jgi:benzoyl-CoA reductase/2-hydroxyglutaryl-CoA dehydratase subunit BcrC/BadD/HgdB
MMKSMFDELSGDPLNKYLQTAIAEGSIPISYTCSHVPEVLLSVGKLLPVRARAFGVEDTELADNYLSKMLCSYVRSILEFAMDGRFDFLEGWVFASSCQHLHRLFDNVEYLTKPKFNHMLNVPSLNNEAAFKWYQKELEGLRQALADQFSIDMSDGPVAAAIIDYNQQVAIIQNIGDLRKNNKTLITGGEFHRLTTAWATMPKKVVCEAAKEFHSEIVKRESVGEYRARLMVVGSKLDDSRFIDTIESQGGLVVADRFCTGSIPGIRAIDESMDPLTAITDHVFQRTRSPMMLGQFDQRLAEILAAVEEYSVDGVVIESMKFCDLWGYESAALVAALRKAGVPVLTIELDYTMGAEGQIRTRVQAFLESMGV